MNSSPLNSEANPPIVYAHSIHNFNPHPHKNILPREQQFYHKPPRLKFYSALLIFSNSKMHKNLQNFEFSNFPPTPKFLCYNERAKHYFNKFRGTFCRYAYRLKRHREVPIVSVCIRYEYNSVLHPLRCHFCIRLFKTNMAPHLKIKP